MKNKFDTLPKLKPGIKWWLPEGVTIEEATRKLGGEYRPLVAGQRWGPGYLPGFEVRVWCDSCCEVRRTSDDVEDQYASGQKPERLYCTDYQVSPNLLAPNPVPQTFAPLPAGESYINPDKITPEQVGVSEGWRLICTLDKTYPEDTQYRSRSDGEWSDNKLGGREVARDSVYARRTKAPLPEIVPAKKDKRQPGAWAEIRSDSKDPTSEIIRYLTRLEDLRKTDSALQYWETSNGAWWVSEADILRNPENIDYLPTGYRFITEEEFAAPAENWPAVKIHSASLGWIDAQLSLKNRPEWSIIVKRDAKFASPAPAAFPELPAGVEWINPEKYTPEQIGVSEGWRPFCSLDERVPEDAEYQNCAKGVFEGVRAWKKTYMADYRISETSVDVTYRTKAPIPTAPTPEVAEEWYNPGKLSQETLGVGYRFLTVEESKADSLPADAEYCSIFGEWKSRDKRRIGSPVVGDITYRVKVVTPAPVEQWHNPAKVASPGEGYRFLTVAEVAANKPIEGLDYWYLAEWTRSVNFAEGGAPDKTLTYRIKIQPVAPDQTPSPVAETEFSGWHNPENVDPKHIPAGYRFATVAESKGLLPIDNGIWSDSDSVSGRFVVGNDDEREPFKIDWTYVVPVSWNLE